MERKLASIQRVLALEPIPGADLIELARINGWQCVVKKGEFNPGDLGVFLEIDAIPPDTDLFRFLWKPKDQPPDQPFDRPLSFRIKSRRIRNTLSQGLLLPLSVFTLPAGAEGDDVTGALGVEKYEPPPPRNMGDYRAPFPPGVPKTDELRVQSFPGVIDELRGHPYVITIKYDGTSGTYYIDPRDGAFHACARNFSILEGDNYYWRAARRYNIEAVLRKNPQYAIQGEVCGPGLQKNRLNLRATDLFVFNVIDKNTGHQLPHDAMREFVKANGLTPVEIIEEGESFAHTLESLLALADGMYPGTKNEREGIVIRSRTFMRSTILGGRMSFKAISNRFLLKDNE